jgi:hypothetical protein
LWGTIIDAREASGQYHQLSSTSPQKSKAISEHALSFSRDIWCTDLSLQEQNSSNRLDLSILDEREASGQYHQLSSTSIQITTKAKKALLAHTL